VLYFLQLEFWVGPEGIRILQLFDDGSRYPSFETYKPLTNLTLLSDVIEQL
jgi:hypothetical protein